MIIIFDWNNGTERNFRAGNNRIMNTSLSPLSYYRSVCYLYDFPIKTHYLKPVNVTLHIGLHAQGG